jgi:hypothetical protein
MYEIIDYFCFSKNTQKSKNLKNGMQSLDYPHRRITVNQLNTISKKIDEWGTEEKKS